MKLPDRMASESEERLVLAFDAGCASCSGVAAQIEEAADDRLEVLSLNDPQVAHWRMQSLGENAPWAPTLIEIRGTKVKAWTGVRMGASLGRRLGPAATWRVMQALGEDRPASVEASKQGTGISRGQFLKGITGGAFAFSIVSATSLGFAAQPAEGDDLKVLSQGSSAVQGLKGSRKVRLASRNFGSPDWNGVTKTAYKENGVSRTLFIIPLAEDPARSGFGAGTFLVTEDDSQVKDATALVVRPSTSRSGEATGFTWLQPDGTLIASADIEDNQLVAREGSAGDSPTGRVQSRNFARCFIRCLGVTVGPRCISLCRFCTSPIGCAPCVACAGIQGIRCAVRCR